MTDAYLTRLAVEISLYATLGLLLEVCVNLGGLSNMNNTEFPNAPGNDIGKFSVDVMYYTIVGVV